MNPATAKARGIKDGNKIKITSPVGSMTTKVRVTEGIQPGVVAISNHCGHWAYGYYASLKKSGVFVTEPDIDRVWWKNNGEHPNWIMANNGDPIGGQMRYMDTVVKVAKV